jgi:hypothetical protein
MRFACALIKTAFEDRADILSNIDPEGQTRLRISSALAIIAQDEHNIMRRISTREVAQPCCGCATQRKTPRRKSRRLEFITLFEFV